MLPAQAATSSQRRSTWWGPSELQWQNYRIENMPSRTKPLLVFVNTKSGPMLGHTLRRKFLRLLNPLQVSFILMCLCQCVYINSQPPHIAFRCTSPMSSHVFPSQRVSQTSYVSVALGSIASWGTVRVLWAHRCCQGGFLCSICNQKLMSPSSQKKYVSTVVLRYLRNY